MSGKVRRTLTGSPMISIGAKIGFIENLVCIENKEQLAWQLVAAQDQLADFASNGCRR